MTTKDRNISAWSALATVRLCVVLFLEFLSTLMSMFCIVSVPGESEEAAGMAVEDIDFGKKCLHLDWHPSEDIMAVAGLNNLYIYST